MQRHLTEGEVERFSLGALEDAEAGPLEEHLLVCSPCQERVSASDSYAQAMRRGATRWENPPAQESRPFFPRLLVPLAAAAVLLLLVTMGIRMMRPGPVVPAVSVTLSATRGPVGAKVPAGAPLVLQPDLTGLPEGQVFGIEIVDSVGNPIWKGKTPGGAAPSLKPATYYVRLYSPAGELLREYGLEAEAVR